MVVQKYHIICNGSTDIFTIRADLILGVPRKSSHMFFVIASARNELATYFLDMFETNIRVDS